MPGQLEAWRLLELPGSGKRQRASRHTGVIRCTPAAVLHPPPRGERAGSAARPGVKIRVPMTPRIRPSPPHLAVRHPHRGLARLRGRRAGLLALVAVVGPGLLAGLSDDDPAGITTYSILGADFGYRLLWVVGACTAALIVFNE